MAILKLEKTEWRSFFDRITKGLVGKRAEIEVDSLDLGSQIEAEWLPLLGIAYDPKDDVLEIALDGVDHPIAKPEEVYVDIGPTGVSKRQVGDRDGGSAISQL